MSVRSLLFLPLLLTCCCPAARDASKPIKAILLDGGPPQSWKMGDRIMVEGRIATTGGGDYKINNVAGYGTYTMENCVLMHGLKNVWRPLRWKAAMLADRDRLVTVTGVTTERFPRFPTPHGGRHQTGSCLVAIEVERIDLL